MSEHIDQRLIGSAMLAALAEHDGADTLKIFETPIKICIFHTCKVGDEIDEKAILSELDGRFIIQNMPLAVFYKICRRMSQGKNKILKALKSDKFQLIADLSSIEDEYRKQERLAHEGIAQIIRKLKLWFDEKVPTFRGDEEYISDIFDKFIKSRGVDILFETDNLRENIVKTVGVENYQIGCFILYIKENDKILFEKMTEIIKGVMIASIIYLGTNEATKFVKKKRMTEVDVYLDTTLLLYALNYKTYEQKNAADALLDLLHTNGAQLHVFREHYNELIDILRNFRDRDAFDLSRTQTLERFEVDNLSSVEIDLEINKLSDNLKKLGVDIVDIEDYKLEGRIQNEDQYIDYKGLEEYIIKEIPGYSRSRKMLTNDVDTIGAICLKRKGIRVEAIESCRAIFVTTNYKLAKVSNRFLKYHQYQLQIPPTIGVMDMTALLWIKYGLLNPDVPMLRLVAIANAAVSPSHAVMTTFYEITGRLAQRGKMTEDEAADMRYSAYARAEIMNSCGGNPYDLDDSTVLNVHSRVKAEYAREEHVRTERAEKQLEDANAQTAIAINKLNVCTSDIKQNIIELQKEAKDESERTSKKLARNLSLAIKALVALFAIISTLLVVCYGLKGSKGFVSLVVAGISGASTIALWVPAFKGQDTIWKYIYGKVEPFFYERNLKKKQEQIDMLQGLLDRNT